MSLICGLIFAKVIYPLKQYLLIRDKRFSFANSKPIYLYNRKPK